MKEVIDPAVIGDDASLHPKDLQASWILGCEGSTSSHRYESKGNVWKYRFKILEDKGIRVGTPGLFCSSFNSFKIIQLFI
jgi:hypothetical protein